MIEFEDQHDSTPAKVAKVQADLRKFLSHPVHLVDWRATSDDVRAAAERDAVEILTQPTDAASNLEALSA